MRNNRNNRNRRHNKFRNNDRTFRRKSENSSSNNINYITNGFQRRFPGKNNHNAPKLLEKYNDLAREALSNGDKILSENYYQHADHFLRIMSSENGTLNNTLGKEEKESQIKIEDENKSVVEMPTQNKKI